MATSVYIINNLYQAYGLNILNAIFAIISISLLQFFNFTITRIRYQNKILVATRKRIYLSFARLLLIPLVVLNFMCRS